jgi:Kef-type K+ transport system membrane component KefB
MLLIGMSWLITMIILAFLTFLGAVFQKTINDFVMGFYIGSAMRHDVGISWWISPLYYVVIVLVAIAVTYRCYQEIVVVTDWYPEQRVFP